MYQREYRKARLQTAREKERRYRELHREDMRTYRCKYFKDPTHRDKRILAGRRYKETLKREVLGHYSPDLTCQRCGYSDIRALSLDHVNSDGTTHRKSIKLWGGHEFYQWVKKNNFPSGLQVLCMNCQWIKRHEKHEWAWKRKEGIEE